MVLCAKYIYIFLLSYYLYATDYSSAESNDSEDADKIKEALVLVDILKTEYIKALRENVAGLLHDKQNSTRLEEHSTCASTTGPPTDNSSHHIVALIKSKVTSPALVAPPSEQALPSPWSATAPPLLTTMRAPAPPPSYISARNSLNDFAKYPDYDPRPYTNFRRRMIPRDYYYNYGNNRRMGGNDRPWNNFYPSFRRSNTDGRNLRFNYDDPFGAHPNETKGTSTASVPTTLSTTAPPPTASSTPTTTSTTKLHTGSIPDAPPMPSQHSTSKSDVTTTGATETTPTAQTRETRQSDEEPTPSRSRGKPTTQQPTRKKPAKTTKKIKDVVGDQVAAELANEIKQIHTEKTKHHNRPARPSRTPLIGKGFPPKSSNPMHGTKVPLMGYSQNFNFIRTTRRIHLARSTRYPIPFPENHAFCYTNPNSALCRTVI